MNKWIVITSINLPQKAIMVISELCKSDGWRCVVVGDKKTPKNWKAKNIDFLSLEDQRKFHPKLSEILPLNHYCRKNIGYIYAADNGADIILETDDDNIPLSNFGKNINKLVNGRLVGESDWVNVYKYFTDTLIWPRGNPLDSIFDYGKIINDNYNSECPVQQYLADGDPDVDAIYRLLFKETLYFRNEDSPVILAKGNWCSFNSQNTLFFKEYFPLLYLPCFVSFRMTDIWRSFVAQTVLWSQGKCLSFSTSSVIQVRNEHNLMNDFNDEVIGYQNNRQICEILKQTSLDWTKEMSIKSKVISAWTALNVERYVEDEEILILNKWMSNLSND